MLEFLKAHPKKIAAVVLFCGLLGVIGGYVLLQYIDVLAVLDTVQEYAEYVARANPIYYMLMVALAPVLVLPVSGFLIVAGLVYDPWVGILICLLGLTFSNVFMYCVSAYWLRGWVEKLIQSRNIQVPEFSESDAIRVIVIFRLIPGFPLTFQNYLLGFARVPFLHYLWISALIQMIPVVGFVVFGDSLMKGKFGIALGAVSLLVVVGIGTKLYFNQQKRKGKLNDVAPESATH